MSQHHLPNSPSDTPQKTLHPAEQRAPYQRPTLEYQGIYHILTGGSPSVPGPGPGEGTFGFSNPFKLLTKV